MKALYLTLSLMLSATATGIGMPWPGYIVSKNSIKLTGHIGAVNHQARSSTVTFINGFGDVYVIEAERIKGFAFKANGVLYAFESKKLPRRYRFLRILHKSGPMELFVLTDETNYAWGPAYRSAPDESLAYWVRPRGAARLFKIGRWGFRRKMRRLLRPYAPELAKKIGQRGYRFDDMPAIIEAYNERLPPKPKPIEL